MLSSPMPPPLLIAGHLAIDFVNSRATPGGFAIDWLRDGESMLGWYGAVSLFPETSLRDLQRSVSPTLLGRVAAEARELRELLRGQLSRPSHLRTNPVLWKTLNELLAQGSAFSVLRKDQDAPRLEDRERLEKPGQLLIPIAKAIARLIVEEDIALLDVVEQLGDRACCFVHGHDMNRQGFLGTDQTVVVSEDGAAQILGVFDDGRAARLHDHQSHFADDGLEPAFEHRHEKRIDSARRFVVA